MEGAVAAKDPSFAGRVVAAAASASLPLSPSARGLVLATYSKAGMNGKAVVQLKAYLQAREKIPVSAVLGLARSLVAAHDLGTALEVAEMFSGTTRNKLDQIVSGSETRQRTKEQQVQLQRLEYSKRSYNAETYRAERRRGARSSRNRPAKTSDGSPDQM